MVFHNEDGSITSNAAPRTLIGDNAIIAAKDAEIARLTAERDDARAQVAMAYEVAAKLPTTLEWCWRFEPHWSAPDIATAIRALTPADATAALARRDAAMRNEGRRQTKVKPLVWDEWDGGLTTAKTPFGKYILGLDMKLSLPTGSYRRYEFEATAKAAAQADYEARILAALEPEGWE